MEILVTFISTNKRGQPQRDQRRIIGPALGVGRGSQSQIHLPDARVALNHARITATEAGPTIEAVDGRVEVNGSKVDGAQLAVGDVVEIGPYEIRVEEPPDTTRLALSVSPGMNFSSPDSMLRRVILRAPSLSKRRLSYLAFAGVLLLSLVVPLLPDLWSDPSTVAPESQRAMVRELVPAVADRFLQSWNPGPVSRGHQIFGADCRTCHEKPFVQVRDSACVACHKTIKEHVPREDLTGELGKAFLGQRCASCHRDHKGTQLAPRAQQLCASCHVQITAAAPNARSKDVGDFSRADPERAHPEFRLSLVDADQPRVVRRVRQGTPRSADMIERSNLKFSHEKHLDPRGVNRDARAVNQDPSADAALLGDGREARSRWSGSLRLDALSSPAHAG